MTSHQPLTDRLARARGTAEPARDSEGRHWSAPAWTGDVDLLDDRELDERIASLSSHIAALSSRYVVGVFSPRSEEDFERLARPWIRERVRLLNLRMARSPRAHGEA